MDIVDLIAALDYADNPNFLTGDALGRVADYAHTFRRAGERMKLQGVYALRQPPSKASHSDTLIPVVYVCNADDESEAREFQRLTWNQNVAPFVLINTRRCVRLFSGFNYSQRGGAAGGAEPILDRTVEFERIAEELAAFTSKAIDNGAVWREYGRFVTPRGRVDWNLLENLEKLDEFLIRSDGLEWRTSHALIGKYVYLWYLRQRDILSDYRLGQWDISECDVFSRNATLKAFRTVWDRLEEWLNGSVFPLDWTRGSAPKQRHLRRVAEVFSGDTLDGQLHLPFDAYDFSIIPVETLSAIYEQFLHAHEPKKERSRGKELGAYYTPVPLVNFMLQELDDKRPLQEGMTCFDPSCGSGAFLVQCYRRLIENRVREDGQAIRRPAELRDILVRHIFGVDRDSDACRVAEMSLILTLLDYVDPPDLSPTHNFKLPDLHNRNIFEADFFAGSSSWMETPGDKQFDWIVGNPPWVEFTGKKSSEDDDSDDENTEARKWIAANADEMPVSGHQLAEAFLWKVTKHLRPDGIAAMLAPAMTLFKSESTAFRQQFFKTREVWCVVNFANLAYVLFAGRAETPATAWFYSSRAEDALADIGSPILHFAPLVATQEANKPENAGSKKDTWSIAVNGSEIREISLQDAASGDQLVWKLAMWGSHLDAKLLRSVAQRFQPLGAVCQNLDIRMHEGFQLRKNPPPGQSGSAPTAEPIIRMNDLIGKQEIDLTKLGRCGRIYSFPDNALMVISEARANVRKGRDKLPLLVSQPPHIIVDAARRFAVYSDEFIAVPPRYAGIAGIVSDPVHNDLLKALSLYLMSDFAIYHQFLTSPQMGIYKARADLQTLRQLPFPLENIAQQGLAVWSDLHRGLVIAASKAPRRSSSRRKRKTADPTPSLFGPEPSMDEISRLEERLNRMVYDALQLRESDIWLISDLVHVRSKLAKGKVDPAATRPPSSEEMRLYCETLKRQLDSFFEVATDARHTVEAIYESDSAMIVIDRGPAQPLQQSVRILAAGDEAANALRQTRERLIRKHSQWLYFQRDLRRYRNGTIYLFKPMQKIHWLRSQALVDAGEIIADTSGGGPT